MMTRRQICPAPLFLVLTCLLLASTGPALAGAWTHPQGEGYYELTGSMLSGDDYRDREGFETLIPTLSEYTLSLYGEYGLRDRLTLVAYLPLFKRVTLNRQIGRESDFRYFGGDDTQGLADAEIGLRRRLVDGDAGVISAALTLGLPLGDDTQPNGLLTGDGELNQRFSLLYGRSLYPAPGYVGLEIAYNLRHGGYDDEAAITAEAGFSWRRASLSFRAQVLESLDNGDEDVSGGAGGLYGNHRRYISFGPRITAAVGDNVAIAASISMVTRLRNGIAAPTFTLGLSTR